jgi:hypothetical protein
MYASLAIFCASSALMLATCAFADLERTGPEIAAAVKNELPWTNRSRRRMPVPIVILRQVCAITRLAE